jgi:hypothetical protein
MAMEGGMNKVVQLAKRIMVFGSMAGTLLWVLERFLSGHWGPGELVVLAAAPLIFGGGLWLLALILDGYASALRR